MQVNQRLNKQGGSIIMSYGVTKYLRTAKRKNRVIVLNSLQGICVALDERSYKIMKFIEENNTEIEKIKAFSETMEVDENSLMGLLNYLKQKGVLYEDC